MPVFRYSALTSLGELVSGELSGPDADAVITQLHNQALLPISATAQQPGRAAARRGLRSPSGPLGGGELALATQQLARLLKAGLPLDRALAILVDLAEGRRMSVALRRILERVRDGSGLADAVALQGKAFPSTYTSLVRAGELSGALQQILSRLAEFLVRAEALRQTVVSALIYPTILIVAAALSVGLVLTAVLPQFEPLFREAGARLPTSTRWVMAAGEVLRADWWALLLAGGLAAVAWRALIRQPGVAQERDRLLLSVPSIGGLITRFEIARFSRALSVTLSSGVPAPTALALCGATVGNRVIAAAIGEAATQFREGEGLSLPLARTGRFPNLAIQLVRVGEESGKLEDMLNELAELYDQEVERTLSRLLAMLVPGLTIMTGALIAFIIAAIMTAMISINDLAV